MTAIDDDLLGLRDLLFDSTGRSSSSLKQELFFKNHQVARLSEEFDKVALLPESQRRVWAEENKEHLSMLLSTLEDDVASMLDGVEFDAESSQLSVEFVTNIRNTMNSIHAILVEST